jgi:predicted glycoside hydrolase/deacetylase ChbG (UPF0249 family)
MNAERCLIVNADDFGQCPGINQGVIQAHEQGIVTSASLMVRWPAAAEAAAYGRGHPALSLGLHVDLGEWACRGGTWVAVYEVVASGDRQAVAEEVGRQLDAFGRLVGRPPTHLDSHQHVHREQPARSLLLEAARRLGVPLRDCTPAVRYRGDFYGQTGTGSSLPEAISVDGLIKLLATLAPGITELGCHPGLGQEINSMYCHERAIEVTTLCHSRVREALAREGIRLWSFREVGVRSGPDFSAGPQSA